MFCVVGSFPFRTEGFRFREFKISDQAFGMDILCAEEEILSLFHNMCHVVVGAVPPVANVDIFPAGERPVPVHDVTECTKFVFFMHGLEDIVRIDVCVKVKKGINMYAVDTAGGAAAHSRGFVNPLLKNIKNS